MAVDIERVVAAAADSFLHGEDGDRGRSSGSRRGRRRLRRASALAFGAGLGLAAHAAYRRVRQIDLEDAAGKLEDRLQG